MKQIVIIIVLGTLLGTSCGRTSQKSQSTSTSLCTKSELKEKYQSKYEISGFAQGLSPVSRILELEGWNVWGCSPIYDEQGRIHVFFSRWQGDHSNWLKNSEIAHAVAERPEGPYKVIGTVLKGRGKGYWDANTIHNPTVQKVGDKYVMFYLGNNVDCALEQNLDPATTQRIGLAMADSLNGEWMRVSDDKPILDTSPNPADWDSYLTTNPALLQNGDGKYWLYYKAWDRLNDNMRKMGLAIADRVEGPYQKYPGNPIISFASIKSQVEDAYAFFCNGKYYMIMRDMGVINSRVGLIMESNDGVHWSAPQLGYGDSSLYFGGQPERMERPQVLMRDGKPAYLFLAISGGKYKTSSGAVLKVNSDQL